MKSLLLRTTVLVLSYSIAMAFLESAVVIYLRAIFYPDGFSFPLKDIGIHLTGTEILRELATLIMLLCVGFLAGKNAIQRFAYFIFSFAIWDIFYYVFLKLIIDWPSSIFEWDILFMFPVIWVGPVITPVICSLLMILLSQLLLFSDKKTAKIHPGKTEWAFLISGSVLVIGSLTIDYILFLHKQYSWFEIIIFSWLSDTNRLSLQYVPDRFNWSVFFAGIFLITTGIIIYFIKICKKQNKKKFIFR